MSLNGKSYWLIRKEAKNLIKRRIKYHSSHWFDLLLIEFSIDEQVKKYYYMDEELVNVDSIDNEMLEMLYL